MPIYSSKFAYLDHEWQLSDSYRYMVAYSQLNFAASFIAFKVIDFISN